MDGPEMLQDCFDDEQCTTNGGGGEGEKKVLNPGFCLLKLEEMEEREKKKRSDGINCNHILGGIFNTLHITSSERILLQHVYEDKTSMF